MASLENNTKVTRPKKVGRKIIKQRACAKIVIKEMVVVSVMVQVVDQHWWLSTFPPFAPFVLFPLFASDIFIMNFLLGP